MGWFTLKNIVRAAPVIIAVAAPEVAVAIGTSLGFSGAAAAAAGSATVAAGTTLAQGGTPEQAAKAGTAAAVGSGVAAESATALGQTGAAAAGGAASGATSATLAGKSGTDVTQAATKGAVVGGGTSAAMQGITDITSEPVAGTGLKGSTGQGTNLASSTQPGTGLTNAIPTTGGQGLAGDPNVILPASLGQYATDPTQVKAGSTGLIPKYSSASNAVLPESLAGYQTDYSSTTQGKPMEQSSLSPETQSALKTGISTLLSQQFKPSGGQPTPTGAPDTSVTSGTTVGLTGERGAGEIEGQGTGGKRKDVWNEASLRLKDALGI